MCQNITIKLKTGFEMPSIGIGPGSIGYGKQHPHFQISIFNRIYWGGYQRVCKKIIDNRSFVKAVSHSLKIGYRLIDNSAAYDNEKFIGKAIFQSRVARSEIFLTSRISNRQQEKGEIKDALFQSLKDLGTDYIDLYMFHWPVPDYYVQTWREMLQLQSEGYIRTLGVANCHKHHLETLEKETGILPSVNQIEIHPLFTQEPLVSYCKEKGIQIQSYTPLGRNDDRLIRSPLLKELGKKYKKTVQQIVLKWHIQKGYVPIPRSLNRERQLQNISIFDFLLEDNEIKWIDRMNINSRLRYDPDNCDFSIL
jgi:diketogulonate reductase-like aldo/keto reductase